LQQDTMLQYNIVDTRLAHTLPSPDWYSMHLATTRWPR